MFLIKRTCSTKNIFGFNNFISVFHRSKQGKSKVKVKKVKFTILSSVANYTVIQMNNN